VIRHTKLKNFIYDFESILLITFRWNVKEGGGNIWVKGRSGEEKVRILFEQFRWKDILF
jgi:hypothetical protein